MRGPRWHDAILVLGVLGLLAFGVYALWGDDLRDWLWPSSPAAHEAPVTASGPGGAT